MEILISTPWKKRFIIWSVLLLNISAGTRHFGQSCVFLAQAMSGAESRQGGAYVTENRKQLQNMTRFTLNSCFEE